MSVKVALLAIIAQCSLAMSVVDIKCVQSNQKLFNNANLIGKWYVMINFNPAITIDYCYCPTLEFTKASTEDLLKYRESLNESVPYSIEDDPIIVNGSKNVINGALFGNKEAKFYVLSPNSPMRQADGYTAQVYKEINDNYILYYDCKLRRNFMKLLSRKREVDKQELEKLIANITDVKYLYREVLCRNYNCHFGI
ncbi:unnamed protein product [Diatraea saccharalis]|uniref:Uncharacterized protein n=1 Tax=Diatraea saccharalis TaxID=40085 RepID=A0A9N9RAZ1_9NEOP|nr:unnamed protein product [Diatraea saccharalis]